MSHREDATGTILCVYLHACGKISLLRLCFVSRNMNFCVCEWRWRLCRLSIYTHTHTHDKAFPWQQKYHKSYPKNSLGLCNK